VIYIFFKLLDINTFFSQQAEYSLCSINKLFNWLNIPCTSDNKLDSFKFRVFTKIRKITFLMLFLMVLSKKDHFFNQN